MKTYEITDARENTHDVEATSFTLTNGAILTLYKNDEIVGIFPDFIAMTLTGDDEE